MGASTLRNRADATKESIGATASTATEVDLDVSPFQCRMKSLLALVCLWSAAPVLMLWAVCSWLRARFIAAPFTAGAPSKKLNILVTGGKMTKTSAVARAVGRDGHNVITAEILPYRFCHTRFSTYVSKHYVLPKPVTEPEAWEKKIKEIVAEHNIDLIIPCTAPVESSPYAHLRKNLPAHVRVFAFDAEVSDLLDNKYTFNQALVRAGLPCPATTLMECTQDAVEFFKTRTVGDSKRFIVKPAVYDPAARTEILLLPIEDKEKQQQYLESRNASKRTPYVIQEALNEPEFGSYALFNQGVLTGFECYHSCMSCMKYEMLPDQEQYDSVRALCTGLGTSMNLTGQLTIDLMHNASGQLVPIECNPRISSAIVTLEGHRNLGGALSDPAYKPAAESAVLSDPSNMQYWIMDQVLLKLGFWHGRNCFNLSFADMLAGSEALLHGDDPLPFLAMYLLQIPSLLIIEVIAGRPWIKIDFCIGKIIKSAGD